MPDTTRHETTPTLRLAGLVAATVVFGSRQDALRLARELVEALEASQAGS